MLSGAVVIGALMVNQIQRRNRPFQNLNHCYDWLHINSDLKPCVHYICKHSSHPHGAAA